MNPSRRLALILVVIGTLVAPGATSAAAIPPANDDFASATRVTTLPFSEQIDLAAATVEPGEPAGTNCFGEEPLYASAWYAFTPAADGQLQVLTYAHFENAWVTIYTGSSIDALTQIDCGLQNSTPVQSGTTYYVRIAAQSLDKGLIDVTLRQTPPPQAAFASDPAEPNSIDFVSFFDRSVDETYEAHSTAWTFGDGATGEFDPVQHQYAADGDYLVGMSITTTDGRTASTQQTISVRTHDVRLTNIGVPHTARPGQTRSIVVSVVDLRYPETVVVRLHRVDEAGPAVIGVKELAMRVGTKASTVLLPYTFTAADAAVGQVSFLATVEILGHTDAVPADNSRSAVTSVKR
jgi:PKD repeat protein